jgi:rhodanese-related sulfurtransferase
MRHLMPKAAQELIESQPEAVFIDVRSEMEHMFVGHPLGSVLIPWIDGPDWEINPNFVSQVKKMASTDRPVILICRSGKRSVDAGLALEKAGLKNVYNVLHGFEGDLDDRHHRNAQNGWRFEGLPWAQT